MTGEIMRTIQNLIRDYRREKAILKAKWYGGDLYKGYFMAKTKLKSLFKEEPPCSSDLFPHYIKRMERGDEIE